MVFFVAFINLQVDEITLHKLNKKQLFKQNIYFYLNRKNLQKNYHEQERLKKYTAPPNASYGVRRKDGPYA